MFCLRVLGEEKRLSAQCVVLLIGYSIGRSEGQLSSGLRFSKALKLSGPNSGTIILTVSCNQRSAKHETMLQVKQILS